MPVKSLEDIVAANLCLGCGLCQAVAGPDRISLHLDNEGFLRPQVLADHADAWNTIKQVCPGLVVQHEPATNGRPRHKLWGPILDLSAGHATDEAVRWSGSSGGAISALLCYLLESNQVNYVLQVGAGSLNPFENQVYLSQSKADVLKCAGSRYAPAAPLTEIKTLLQQDSRPMAFVGKPCDVAAFRAFLRFYPELAAQVKCIISFFCAGTSSLHATEKVIAAMGADKSQVVQFKYRGQGWPGQAQAKTADGTSYEMSYHDSWGKILGRQLQFRCKICPDGIGELADITCADAWYLKEDQPDFTERPGRSLIFSRTPLGQRIVNEARKAGYLDTTAFPLVEVELLQPYQAMRRRLVASRLLALVIAGVPRPKFKGFHLVYNGGQTSLKNNWSNFEGTLRRLKDRPENKQSLIFRVLKVTGTTMSWARRRVTALITQ